MKHTQSQSKTFKRTASLELSRWYRFALEDGRVVQGAACAGVPVYDCKIANDQVQIKLRQ